jgi:hypothetical protein
MQGYSNKDYYVPWVSIPNNNSIQLDINVRKLKRNAQKDDNFKVRFIPSASNISINNQDSLVLNYDQLNSQNPIQISVDYNTVEDFDNPDYIGVYNQNGQIIGKLAVIKRDMEPQKIHFIYVDNGNGTGNLMSHNTILDFLNNYSHNQFFINWVNEGIDTLHLQNVQINNSTQMTNYMAQMYKNKTGVDVSGAENKKFFFITDIEIEKNGGQVGGNANTGGSYGALFKTDKEMKENAAHECGHLLGLPHSFCGDKSDESGLDPCLNCVKRGGTDRTITESSSNNFMDYNNPKEAFYLYQWYYIINNVDSDDN